MQLGLGGAGCQSKHLGNLFVTISLDIVKHEHFPCAVRQSLHSGLEVHRHFRSGPAGRDHVQGRVAVEVTLSPGAEGLPARQNHVDGKPVKPGAEGRLTPKGPQLLPGSNEDVLGYLVGVIIVEHAADQPIHLGHVSSVEPLERAGITTGGQGRVHCVRIGPAGLLVLQCRHSEAELVHRG
jgi:hypothetical protein